MLKNKETETSHNTSASFLNPIFCGYCGMVVVDNYTTDLQLGRNFRHANEGNCPFRGEVLSGAAWIALEDLASSIVKGAKSEKLTPAMLNALDRIGRGEFPSTYEVPSEGLQSTFGCHLGTLVSLANKGYIRKVFSRKNGASERCFHWMLTAKGHAYLAMVNSC